MAHSARKLRLVCTAGTVEGQQNWGAGGSCNWSIYKKILLLPGPKNWGLTMTPWPFPPVPLVPLAPAGSTGPALCTSIHNVNMMKCICVVFACFHISLACRVIKKPFLPLAT